MIYVGAILVVSSVPRLSPPPGWTGADKLAHVAEYGILGYLLARAVGAGGTGRWLIAFLIGGVVGASDEIYQSTVPGRFPSWLDWGADLLGNGLGAAGHPLLAARLSRRPRARIPEHGRK